MRLWASISKNEIPRSDKVLAALRPAAPAPIITTSGFFGAEAQAEFIKKGAAARPYSRRRRVRSTVPWDDNLFIITIM